MRHRFAYFSVILSILAIGSLWSPSAKQFLTPVLLTWWPRAIPFSRMQDIEHFFAYTAAALVALFIWRGATQAALALLSLTGIALGSEMCQHWMYHVRIEWPDIRHDLAGLAFGYVLVLVFRGFFPQETEPLRRRF